MSLARHHSPSYISMQMDKTMCSQRHGTRKGKNGCADAGQNMDPSTGMDITLEAHTSRSWQTHGSMEALHLWP